METFSITKKEVGKTFNIRPLPNIKDIKNSIMSYRTIFNESLLRWEYRNLCFALVNNELKIFEFSDHYNKYIKPDMISLKSNLSIMIKVKQHSSGFLENSYDLIEDEKNILDNTEDKRNYIKNLLENTVLDLEIALEQKISKMKKYQQKNHNINKDLSLEGGLDEL